MKKYTIVQKVGNDYKSLVVYYDLKKAKLRKINFEKVYPNKEFYII